MKLKKIDIETLIMACMVIVTLSFHDKTILLIVFQLLALIYQIIKRHGQIKISNILTKYLAWEFIFIIFSLISFFWAITTKTIISCVISLCQVVMCGISIIMYCDVEEKKERFVKYIMIACIVLIIRLLITVPINAWVNNKRIGQYLGSGNSGGYGNTGLTYVLSVGAIFALDEGMKRKSRIFYILFGVFTVFSMLSGSKKAIIIFGITIILMAIFTSKNVIKLIKSSIIAGSLILLAWYIIMHNPVLYRMVGIRFNYLINYFLGSKTDASTITRADYFKQAMKIFKNHPIVGIGLDGFRYFNSRQCWAENNYAELMADLGIIGCIIYYSFPISFVIKAFKSRIHGNVEDAVFVVFLSCFLLILDISMVTYSNDFLQLYFVFSYVAFSIKTQNSVDENMEEFKNE